MGLFKRKLFFEKLSEEIRQELSKRLTKEELSDFISLSEKFRLYRNYLHFKNLEPDFAISSFVSTLTSFANEMGKGSKLISAKRGIELALKLNPHHIPAYMSLAVFYIGEGNKNKALDCCDKATKVYKELMSIPKEELTYYDRGSLTMGEGGLDSFKDFIKKHKSK